MSSLSASLSMNSSLGPGKVRAMFHARRMGQSSSAQNSPVGWDKSYPLEPIGKDTPPTDGRQKRTPPGRSGAGRRAERSPPQQTVSRGKGKGKSEAARGAPLRRAKSHGSIETPQQRRATKPATRSTSVGRTKKKPPRRQEDRNRINDVMRRREGELLDKIKDTTQEPAGLKPRAPRRSKSKSPAPPKPAAKPAARKALSPARNRKGAGSRRASFNAGSRRPSVKPPEAPRPPPTDPNMAQCPICTRSFLKDRLEKHQEICEKSHAKKRKVFDPIKMRVKGTESEQYIKQIKQDVGSHEKKSPKKVDWRKQHEEFVANIRAAKKAQAHVDAGGNLADLPPPPPSENPDYVQCPHCGRRFNEAAAERHIPKCSSISSNKGPPAGKQGGRGGRKRR